MALTSGFFNSLNGDRRYDALQFSSIFDGVINDGIFGSVGDKFVVLATTGNVVTIGTGRAWFDHTWILNDSPINMMLAPSESVLHRIDMVCIEVDHTETVRASSIKIVSGTPSSTPVRPTPVRGALVNQYPLAYITRQAGSTSIVQANIASARGTSQTPLVTGILEFMTIDSIVAQWEAQWATWTTEQLATNAQDMTEWMNAQRLLFNDWFTSLNIVLSGEVATNLANQILALQGQFKTLIEEQTLYAGIFDSDGDPIMDNNGESITGKIVYAIK